MKINRKIVYALVLSVSMLGVAAASSLDLKKIVDSASASGGGSPTVNLDINKSIDKAMKDLQKQIQDNLNNEIKSVQEKLDREIKDLTDGLKNEVGGISKTLTDEIENMKNRIDSEIINKASGIVANVEKEFKSLMDMKNQINHYVGIVKMVGLVAAALMILFLLVMIKLIFSVRRLGNLNTIAKDLDEIKKKLAEIEKKIKV